MVGDELRLLAVTLGARGAACRVEATQLCVIARGTRKPSAIVVASAHGSALSVPC